MALLDGLGRALKRLDCAVLGAGDYIFGSLNALQGLDQGTTADVINGYRRLRGCNPANDPAPPPPPFAGGQCAGVFYNIFLTQNNTNNGTRNPEALRGTLAGPLTVTETTPAPDFCGDAVATAESWIHTSGTDPRSGIALANAGAGSCTLFPWNTAIRVVRADGSPDNCGDPTPVLPPAAPINIDVDVEYTDEGDNIVNVTIPVQFNPFTVNFNGDVSFPIEFSLGGIDFNGDVSFFPDFDLNVRGPSFPKGGGGKELPTGDPDDERPEAKPEAIIIGAVVTAQAISDQSATAIDFQNGPDIFVPRLGSLKFAYSIGAATFWSNDIDIKGPRVFIPCPFSQGADAIQVSPVPGVSLTATPVFGFPLATIGDIKTVLDVV